MPSWSETKLWRCCSITTHVEETFTIVIQTYTTNVLVTRRDQGFLLLLEALPSRNVISASAHCIYFEPEQKIAIPRRRLILVHCVSASNSNTTFSYLYQLSFDFRAAMVLEPESTACMSQSAPSFRLQELHCIRAYHRASHLDHL